MVGEPNFAGTTESWTIDASVCIERAIQKGAYADVPRAILIKLWEAKILVDQAWNDLPVLG